MAAMKTIVISGPKNNHHPPPHMCDPWYGQSCCCAQTADDTANVWIGPVTPVRYPASLRLESSPSDLTFLDNEPATLTIAFRDPDDVPPDFLIPPSAFASDHDIKRFPDIAQRLGIDTFNQCGGAILEDFDNDGLLDIVTSTFDPEGSLTYYHNSGDGTFEDRSGVSRLDDQLGGLNTLAADYNNDGYRDILVLRGRKYAPHPVEQAVDDLEGVRRGCAAAVTHLPEGGEREALLLLVEHRQDADEAGLPALPEACRIAVLQATGLALDEAVVLTPGTLPRTSSGKIRRRAALALYRSGELSAPDAVTLPHIGRSLVRSKAAFARLKVADWWKKRSGS